jgi:hypothetical protein
VSKDSLSGFFRPKHLWYIYLPFSREYIKEMAGDLISLLMLATDRIRPKEGLGERP